MGGVQSGSQIRRTSKIHTGKGTTRPIIQTDIGEIGLLYKA
jgi:hypothetical protein